MWSSRIRTLFFQSSKKVSLPYTVTLTAMTASRIFRKCSWTCRQCSRMKSSWASRRLLPKSLLCAIWAGEHRAVSYEPLASALISGFSDRRVSYWICGTAWSACLWFAYDCGDKWESPKTLDTFSLGQRKMDKFSSAIDALPLPNRQRAYLLCCSLRNLLDFTSHRGESLTGTRELFLVFGSFRSRSYLAQASV